MLINEVWWSAADGWAVFKTPLARCFLGGVYCRIISGIITIHARNAILDQPVECNNIRWHFIFWTWLKWVSRDWTLIQIIPNIPQQILVVDIFGIHTCWTSWFVWKKVVCMLVVPFSRGVTSNIFQPETMKDSPVPRSLDWFKGKS